MSWELALFIPWHSADSAYSAANSRSHAHARSATHAKRPPRNNPMRPETLRQTKSVRQPDLHEIVVEHRSVPEIRLSLRRRLIGVRTVRRELAPPDRRRPHDARTNSILDARHGRERPAVIVHHDSRTHANSAALGIHRMEQTFRFVGGSELAWVRESWCTM